MKLDKKSVDLKPFIYGDDIIIWGDVKELETKLTHWERVNKEYGLEINLKKIVMLKLSGTRKKHYS
jgi:hypothetical protein